MSIPALEVSHSFIWDEQYRISQAFSASFADRVAAFVETIHRGLVEGGNLPISEKAAVSEIAKQIADQFERENPGFFGSGRVA